MIPIIKRLKNLVFVCAMCLISIQFVSGQKKQNYLITKGGANITVITTGSVTSTQCTVFEYPDFLVVHEIPVISTITKEKGAAKVANPLITFIDSVFSNKPIRYVLNSHHHSHSLSTVMPFLKKGATLVTSKKNIDIYRKRGLFDQKEYEDYFGSIIQISSDTVLLSETNNPIEVLYLKKADYASIPTETFLFFYFPKEKLLAASCMVHLQDFNKKYGFKGVVFNDRLIDANKIITDKNIDVEKTLQLFRLRFEDDQRKPPIFAMSYFQNVLNHSWHRRDLAEHFQNMSFEDLTTKKDSLLSYLGGK